MAKDYFFFNEEPNTNILGLNPIVEAFHTSEMRKFTGSSLSIIVYELDGGKLRAGTLSGIKGGNTHRPIADYKAWAEFADYLFKKIVNDKNFEKDIVVRLKNRSNKIYRISKLALKNLKQNKLSEKNKKEIIKELFSLFTSICVYGLIGPIIEIAGGRLSGELEKIFKSKTKNIAKISKFSSLLTFRFKEGYDQKGQKALAKIAQKIYQNKKYIILFNKNNEEIESLLPKELKKLIDQYVFEWGWLTYSYCGPEYTINNAINDIKGMLALEISPAKQIKYLSQDIKNNIKKQQELLKEAKFNQKELYLLKVAQDISETKALRTKAMFLADFTINNLLKSFIIKEGISFSQLGVCTVKEVLNYFRTGKFPSTEVLNDRLKYCVLISGVKGEKILVGGKARKWIQDNVKIEKVNKNIKEMTGQIACRGKAGIIKGRVKIVNVANEMKKFNAGDILVSIATTPEIVPAMKIAKAIITNIGGLTCHAAIVSRELNKPCIIGTKIATQVLRDGDFVEVDTDNGVIKILNKK